MLLLAESLQHLAASLLMHRAMARPNLLVTLLSCCPAPVASQLAWPVQVQWDRLVPGRSSVIAQRRWRMMTKCLPQYWDIEFGEAVREMARVFAPGLLPVNGR